MTEINAPAAITTAQRRQIVMAELAYRGVLIELDLFDLDESTLRGIERRIDKLLTREGWAAPQPPQPAAPAAPAQSRLPRPRPKIMPHFDESGQACCPVHGNPLLNGKGGPYCPSRAEGEHANAKGYCSLRFLSESDW